MATPSEVKSGLDQISTSITTAKLKLKAAVLNISRQKTDLSTIPSDHADVIATVDSYTGTDAFEDLCKAELARMTTEFQALVADVSLAIIDLGKRTEF